MVSLLVATGSFTKALFSGSTNGKPVAFYYSLDGKGRHKAVVGGQLIALNNLKNRATRLTPGLFHICRPLADAKLHNSFILFVVLGSRFKRDGQL